MSSVEVSNKRLRDAGIETLRRGISTSTVLPRHTVIEAPAGVKWTEYGHSIEMGAFSYQVSGYCFGARIGRYCSFGENVQIGRQDHPTDWVSSSPAFYIGDKMFDLGSGFAGSDDYHNYGFVFDGPATRPQITHIGHDVWIGHGAYIRAGVTIGTGAIIAAHAVVTKDVPPYSVVAGNPGTLKKLRLSPELITAMMHCRWWRFAPWQMQHLNPRKIKEFAAGIHSLARSEPEFEPDILDLRAEIP